MKSITQLINKINEKLKGDSIADFNDLLKEIEQFERTDEYRDLDLVTQDEMAELNKLKKQIRDELKYSSNYDDEKTDSSSHFENQNYDEGPQPEDEPVYQSSVRPTPSPHPAEAVNLFNQAQDAFLDGKYDEADKLAQQALQIDLGYKSAINLLATLESYRSGDVQNEQLPPNLRTLYNTAEQMLLGIDSRLAQKDYENASAFIKKASESLNEAQKQYFRLTQQHYWPNADNLKEKIDRYTVQIDTARQAEAVFQGAVALLSQGAVEKAIEQAQAANEIEQKAQFSDKIEEWQRFKSDLEEVTEIFSLGSTSPEELAQAYRTLASYHSKREYQVNPLLTAPWAGIEQRIPDAITSLIGEKHDGRQGEIARLLQFARTERQIEEAAKNIDRAAALLETLRILMGTSEGRKLEGKVRSSRNNKPAQPSVIDVLSQQTNKVKQEIETNSTLLEKISVLVAERKYVQAKEVGKHLFDRFSGDPDVQTLKSEIDQHLRKETAEVNSRKFIQIAKILGILIAAVVVISFAGMGIKWGWDALNRPTPTPGPTATITSPTIAPPTATPRPTDTPRPMTGYTRRNIWTRNGCYDNFTASGHVPARTAFTIISLEERVDPNGNKCSLIETTDFSGKGVTGWALNKDLEIIP